MLPNNENLYIFLNVPFLFKHYQAPSTSLNSESASWIASGTPRAIYRPNLLQQ